MKILIVSNLLPPRILGGYELSCYRIARGLREHGHDVRVLTSPCEERTADDQSFVSRTLALRSFESWYPPTPSTSMLREFESRVSQWSNTLILLDELRRFRPDHVVLFNLVGIGGLALIDLIDRVGVPWTMNLGDAVPVVLSDESLDDVLDVFGATGGEVFRHGQTAAVSQTLVDEIESHGIPLGERVAIIPRGIRAETLRSHSRPYRDGGHTRFIAVGSLHPFKGVGIIVDAAALVRAAGIEDFSVTVYGKGDPEPFRAQASQAGVSDLVTFGGFVDHETLMDRYAESDALVFPTWPREPGASVPFEAAAAGCLPILTGSCGPAERLADGVHAVKISRDPTSLAAAMTAVIDGSVDLEAAARHGRTLVEGDLSFETSILRLTTLLESDLRPGWDDALDDNAIDIDVSRKHDEALGLVYRRILADGL